ncbi:TPA: hypothetical protein DCY43_02520 [candidate division WWE3 bacterium]|uniref:Uncharacterized protein n=5 Tax=Katanobacteria TaxID=422282 RepID=A0A0G1NLX2_UNCKA|nr:MAG: hypothetical protein UW36_C0007G0020 [candidate division WWE3 bacterium GW2011_GWA2_44_16]KKT69848.1 MAG: hypothetical protein UW65_C0010G0006 [candidate division WWE3 bacterium GW2011_GWB1_44_4]KKT85209.1 MAG: hypothetical protein UW82_C0001G0020 [candidate division WWE3 bacterium GW2011_GWC2_44_9]OGC52506.1 MAG: hypothetical protein A2709_00880 [candidate division WWE3 bacterium RIFCSPHIGHO2_01_FULL_43_9]HAZ29600.1 hypothetical protein [candidate division WWE3 bacterium]
MGDNREHVSSLLCDTELEKIENTLRERVAAFYAGVQELAKQHPEVLITGSIQHPYELALELEGFTDSLLTDNMPLPDAVISLVEAAECRLNPKSTVHVIVSGNDGKPIAEVMGQVTKLAQEATGELIRQGKTENSRGRTYKEKNNLPLKNTPRFQKANTYVFKWENAG